MNAPTVVKAETAYGTTEAISPSLAAAVATACEAVTHNLVGQKLGPKGRVTRERILTATIELLDAPTEEPVTLSAVARKASLGMTSLYNYFTDLGELLLAVLEPVMATAEEAYLAIAREYWPDEELAERCYAFVHAYHCFWARHSRLLHMRNSLADRHDERMMHHRIGSSTPIIGLLVRQMGDFGPEPPESAVSMATMLMIGVERSITVATDRKLPKVTGLAFTKDDERFLNPGARLMELAIRDQRAATPDKILSRS